MVAELTFVEEAPAGEVILPFEGGPFIWSTSPFGERRCSLDGISCRVQSLASLSADKGRPREDAEGGDKDRADLASLAMVDKSARWEGRGVERPLCGRVTVRRRAATARRATRW